MIKRRKAGSLAPGPLFPEVSPSDFSPLFYMCPECVHSGADSLEGCGPPVAIAKFSMMPCDVCGFIEPGTRHLFEDRRGV